MNTIKFLREQCQLSQAALAAELGVNQQAIARWENGTADPRWEMAPKLPFDQDKKMRPQVDQT